jgi:two-component system sensor histidine kinase DesK
MKARTAKEFRRKWIPGATVAMIFLIFPAQDILSSHHAPIWQVLGLVVVFVIGTSYLFLTPSAMSWPIKKQLGLLISLLAVTALAWPVVGSSLVVFWIFIGITAGVCLSMRNATIFVGTLAVGMLLLSGVDHQAAPWALAGTMIGLSLWMCAFMGNIRLTNELRQTRQVLADAAVVAERERIGRDLHDILGHSLTAIAVKAAWRAGWSSGSPAMRSERSPRWNVWLGRRLLMSGPPHPGIERSRSEPR